MVISVSLCMDSEVWAVDGTVPLLTCGWWRVCDDSGCCCMGVNVEVMYGWWRCRCRRVEVTVQIEMHVSWPDYQSLITYLYNWGRTYSRETPCYNFVSLSHILLNSPTLQTFTPFSLFFQLSSTLLLKVSPHALGQPPIIPSDWHASLYFEELVSVNTIHLDPWGILWRLSCLPLTCVPLMWVVWWLLYM